MERGGQLLVLIPGMGAVASTFIAGVELIRRGLRKPIGSLTQLGRFTREELGFPSNGETGKRSGSFPRTYRLNELLPLTPLDELSFAGWDVIYRDLPEALELSQVLDPCHIQEVKPHIASVPVLDGYFQKERVPVLSPRRTIVASSLSEVVSRIRRDIHTLMERQRADRAVMVLLLSTETLPRDLPELREVKDLESAIRNNHPAISPTLLYTYSALLEGIPVINGTPNLALEIPAIVHLSELKKVCLAGKDLKTGQTFIKTALAPALRIRNLGVKGWFSTNILGNRDGEVLDHPEAFHSKEVTKSKVLQKILDPDLYPELYEKIHHKVRIEYYPPRGDAKEGWDNIDLFGWLGYPMQLKINFLCRDSILAAPVVLDLVLLTDLAQRQGEQGLLSWLSFYFKDPLCPQGVESEHDLFLQHRLLLQHLASYIAEGSVSSFPPSL